MSMDRCQKCERSIDTDLDPDCYPDEDICLCRYCRDELEARGLLTYEDDDEHLPAHQ